MVNVVARQKQQIDHVQRIICLFVSLLSEQNIEQRKTYPLRFHKSKITLFSQLMALKATNERIVWNNREIPHAFKDNGSCLQK